MKIPPPPPSLALYVDALGIDNTLRLIEAHGGTTIWIPKGVNNSSAKRRKELEDEFGAAMVKELIALFGGGPIEVPLAKPWRAELYKAQGMTMTEIARKLGLSYRTIKRRHAGDKSNAEQFSLF